MTQSQSTTLSIRRRQLLRRAEPRPWFPGVLLPLLLWLVAAGVGLLIAAEAWIENPLREDVQTAMQDAHPWVQVRASGQDITLTGTPPTEQAGRAAIAVATETRSHTWLGRLISPVGVIDDFSDPQPPERAAWTVRKQPDRLTMTGTVQSAARDDMRKLGQVTADLASPPLLLVDELTTAATDASGGVDAGRHGLAILASCLTGRVAVAEGTMSVACEVAAPDDEAELYRLAAVSVDHVSMGEVQVIVQAEADACDAALAKLLEEPIRFHTGSAAVQPASEPLLDALADSATHCPGILRIEGHTDSDGNLDMNLKLSEARAQAVKNKLIERGVDETHLITVGHGPNQPLADNASPEGKAANRRIEIEVVRPTDL